MRGNVWKCGRMEAWEFLVLTSSYITIKKCGALNDFRVGGLKVHVIARPLMLSL